MHTAPTTTQAPAIYTRYCSAQLTQSAASAVPPPLRQLNRHHQGHPLSRIAATITFRVRPSSGTNHRNTKSRMKLVVASYGASQAVALPSADSVLAQQQQPGCSRSKQTGRMFAGGHDDDDGGKYRKTFTPKICPSSSTWLMDSQHDQLSSFLFDVGGGVSFELVSSAVTKTTIKVC